EIKIDGSGRRRHDVGIVLRDLEKSRPDLTWIAAVTLQAVKFLLPSVNRRLDVDAHVPIRARGDFSDVDLWTGRTCRLGRALALGTEAACDAAPEFGDVGDCAVWAPAPAMPSNRTATKARAISRNRSIIGCPLTGNPLSRRLTVDGVDNKGWLSPGGIPCLN